MKTLSVVEPMNTTAIVTVSGGEHPFYVCNPFNELAVAVAGEDKFIAHKVVAMAPQPIVLEPKFIASVEALR